MGLDSIWREDGEYLTKASERFRARSTGCDCCSVRLDTEEEVLREAIDSMVEILLAQRYFGWKIQKIITEAKKDEKIKAFKTKVTGE